MSERRYNEAEVEAIFARAAHAPEKENAQPLLSSGEGMTLSQLQEIGREAGFTPEAVADAARSIDRVGQVTSRTFLGLPIGVGRTVELGRKLSEEEWERLVVDLRETFDARGRLRNEGSFRQWTNGNLQALLEPTPTGHRLRLKTLKGNAVSWMMGGFGMVAIGGLILVARALGISQGGMTPEKFAMIAAIGAGMFAIGALQLPAWARERRRQMAEIVERLSSKTGDEGAR
jgi:hypothetical protein